MNIYPTQSFIRPDLQAHIFSDNLLANVRNLKGLCRPGTKFCAVVKANAYGHGISEIVNILQKNKAADFYAVASIYEAIHIAPLTDGIPVLILEPIHTAMPQDQLSVCARNGLHCVISSLESLRYASEILKGSSYVLRLHVNVESGMGRCGINEQDAVDLINAIDQNPNTALAGVYTHFATADEEDLSYGFYQLKRFNDFLSAQNIRDRKDIIIHAANSAATIKIPGSHYDMVRCGISMYGYYSRRMKNPPIDLKPVMRLQAPVVQMKNIPAGHSVSYGRSYTPYRDIKAAIVPLGYADGYWRSFSNKAKMLINDQPVDVIGRVCMDQVIIDITDVEDVSIGQMVTVLDCCHDSPCGGYALADLAGTICYEILTCVHEHVNRIIH